MNLSLTNRVKITFIVANVVVLITGFLMYFFLGSLADKTKSIWLELQTVTEIEEKVRENIVVLTSRSVKIVGSKELIKILETYQAKIIELKGNVERLNSEFEDIETRALVESLLKNVETLEEYLGKPDSQESYDRFSDSNFHLNLTQKISKSFAKYLEKSRKNNQSSSEEIKDSIASIKKNMLLVLILSFLGTIVLAWLVPNKVALPFKKINHAVRELQDCNFDVAISYDENDELGELSHSLNKMIAQLKMHEELRSDKFVLESKKFNIIANHFSEKVLVVNSDGRLTYMNNDLYSMFRVETSDVIDKEIDETIIPEAIVSVFQKALKRRGKIENEEIKFSYKKVLDEDQEEEIDFTGYAEIYPIRGKESSLDYYLMIINEEMMA